MSEDAAAAPDARAARLAELIIDVPDWPTPGVVFKDITPVLDDPVSFALCVDLLAAAGRGASGEVLVDKVVGIEARGFILAAPVALALGAGFVPVRKAGKLPRAVHSATYQLEYGEATLQVQQDAFSAGDRVLVVDDVLATGGTLAATCDLVARAGGTVAAVSVLIELSFLPGRAAVPELDVRSVIQV